MDRTERLLDLVALLLDSTEPVSWATLRETFPEDYGRGKLHANERKFERDKAELAELGIPITYCLATDDNPEGYVIDRSAYYLPEIDFTPEELAVLYAAGSAAVASGAFPGRVDLAHALRKISFASGLSVDAVPSRLLVVHPRGKGDLPERLEALWGAVLRRKWVEIEYRSPARDELTRRRVDPWGLCLRRGVWLLVGHCHLRQAERAFHVDRLQKLTVNEQKPKSPDFDLPQGLDLGAYAAEEVWQHKIHEPMAVELQLAPALAPMAGRLFPKAAVKPGPDGSARVELRASYLDGLLRTVIALGTDAQVVAPDSARARMSQMLEKALAVHGGKLSGRPVKARSASGQAEERP